MGERLSGTPRAGFARAVEGILEAILILAVIALAMVLLFPLEALTAPSDREGEPSVPQGVAVEEAIASVEWMGKVSASADDAFARPRRGVFKNRYAREYIRLRPGSWGGLRFQDVPIPPGAQIQQAYLRLYISEKDQASILFYGEVGSESPDFAELDPVSRRRTLTSHYWQKHNLGNNWRETPNLAGIIQEIVDQPRWEAGSPMVLLMESTAGSLRFHAWEKDPLTAAELHIVFQGDPGHVAEGTRTLEVRSDETATPSAPTHVIETTGTPTPTGEVEIAATDTPSLPTTTPTSVETLPTATEISPTATSSPTVPPPDPPNPTPTAEIEVGENASFSGPVQINASNYDAYHSIYQSIGPFIVRAVVLQADRYERGVNEIERIQGYGENVVDYRIGFGSVAVIEQLLESGEAQRLRDLGVTSLTYNPEGQHTPEGEFSRRFDANDQNPIVRFSRLADAYGFRAIWAPLRADADRIGDEALALIYSTGLDGLALQEQRFIENACVDTRTDAVEATIRRHSNIAGRQIELTVQIMSSRCSNGDSIMSSCGEGELEYQYQHCDLFVDALVEQSTLDVLAIWPNGDESSLIEIMR